MIPSGGKAVPLRYQMGYDFPVQARINWTKS